MDVLHQGVHLDLQPLRHILQVVGIDRDTTHFQIGEHVDQGHLDFFKQPIELMVGELGFLAFDQQGRDIGIFRTVGGRSLDIDLVKSNLLGPLASDVFIAHGRVAEILLGEGIEIVGPARGVEEIARHHGIKGKPLHADPMPLQHNEIILDILPVLGMTRVFQQGA